MHGKLKNYLIQNHIFIICQTKKQQQNIPICSSSVCSKKNKSYRISPVHLECYLCDKGIFLNQLLSKFPWNCRTKSHLESPRQIPSGCIDKHPCSAMHLSRLRYFSFAWPSSHWQMNWQAASSSWPKQPVMHARTFNIIK